MPQWDFLNFLVARARNIPEFQLLMQHETTALLNSGGRITGVVAQSEGREVHLYADLVVGCDGRHSVTRKAAGLEVIEQGVPIDVLWFRISRKPDDPGEVFGNVNYGRALILVNRSSYFQAGFIIPKGSFDEIQSQGLDAFRSSIVRIVPYLVDRVHEIQSWDQVKILTVQINRLRRWYLDVCSASETPPTPCPPPAESASTSPFRMPSPPPTSWQIRCWRAVPARPRWLQCSAAERFPRASPRPCSCWHIAESPASSPPPAQCEFPGRSE
jgi:hypothetical protein